MMGQFHYLKTWPEFYDEVESGKKTFELRQNDRDFQEGDTLVLQCFDPQTKTYDGRELLKEATYVLLGGVFGLQEGFCIIGFGGGDA